MWRREHVQRITLVKLVKATVWQSCLTLLRPQWVRIPHSWRDSVTVLLSSEYSSDSVFVRVLKEAVSGGSHSAAFFDIRHLVLLLYGKYGWIQKWQWWKNCDIYILWKQNAFLLWTTTIIFQRNIHNLQFSTEWNLKFEAEMFSLFVSHIKIFTGSLSERFDLQWQMCTMTIYFVSYPKESQRG